jgi:hypothetical protein
VADSDGVAGVPLIVLVLAVLMEGMADREGAANDVVGLADVDPGEGELANDAEAVTDGVALSANKVGDVDGLADRDGKPDADGIGDREGVDDGLAFTMVPNGDRLGVAGDDVDADAALDGMALADIINDEGEPVTDDVSVADGVSLPDTDAEGLALADARLEGELVVEGEAVTDTALAERVGEGDGEMVADFVAEGLAGSGTRVGEAVGVRVAVYDCVGDRVSDGVRV